MHYPSMQCQPLAFRFLMQRSGAKIVFLPTWLIPRRIAILVFNCENRY